MHDYSFEFNGVDMFTEYGLKVDLYTGLLQPELRARKIEIPKRDGSYDFGAEYYNERALTLNCEVEDILTQTQRRELVYLLSKKGDIVLWNEPDKTYKGQVYIPSVIETLGREVVDYITLDFICDPFLYGETKIIYFSGSVDPAYLGTAQTPTRIQITNSGVSDITGINIAVRRRRD